jgi:protein-S-isoprenylcysteine O-methyltransferase Ste14
VPFALAGEALRVWASGHLDKTRALATGGPYAHTRNPLYLGSLLLAVALSVASSSAGATAAVAVYLLAFYPSVMREEARFLAAKFPATYESWAGAVPALVPRLRPAGPRESRFEWRRVRLNREWRTAAALPALALLLWARGAWS